MPNQILQVDENMLETKLDRLVSEKVEQLLNAMLDAEADEITGAAEVMECVAGDCEYKLAGSDSWQKSGPGERFAVPAHSSFDIRVADAYHYICHYA